jgi:predicted amidohydrolase
MIIISTTQFKPRFARCPADVSDNLRRCLNLVYPVLNSGTSILVLPELAFTGYSFHNFEQAFAASENVQGPTFREIQKLAIAGSMYVAYGYVEFDNDRLYNSCNLVSPTGELVSHYRKINLWGPDFLWATPGSNAPEVVKTEYGFISTVICRDIKLKTPDNIPRTASSVPFYNVIPDIILACTNWGKGGFPSTTWMDFVTNKQTTLVISNRYGTEENDGMVMDFGSGGIAVIEPDWTVRTDGLKYDQDCVVTVALERLKNRR